MTTKILEQKIIESIKSNPHKDVIAKVSLFGSYLHGKPKKNSDIDLLIEFKPNSAVGYFKLAQIQRYFMEQLKKDVDLVTPGALSKYFREDVLANAKKLYEQR